MEPGPGRLESLAAALAGGFRAKCRIDSEALDISFALDAERRQYWSTAILQRLQKTSDPAERVLGVTVRPLRSSPDLCFWRSPA